MSYSLTSAANEELRATLEPATSVPIWNHLSSQREEILVISLMNLRRDPDRLTPHR
jgi:hypothetical protein